MRYVVDTNVPVVANGAGTKATPQCRLAAIDFLESLLVRGTILLDLDGEIQEEYLKRLHQSQPGVGTRFLIEVLNSHPQRVERHPLDRNRDGSYADFPKDKALKRFDPSDRKFAALSRKSKAPVANAVDSDWLEHREALSRSGITVEFLCGCDPRAWLVE